MTIDAPDLAATDALGRRLGALLFPGAVVALVGPLGAGKTHFTRAVAVGLGVPEDVVTSPTFVLIQEYEGGRLPVYHFDTYRLDDPEAALAALGVGEYFEGEGVCLVEWADRIAGLLPADHLRVTIEPTGESARRFTLAAAAGRHADLIRRLAADAAS